jgi:hypothetical protein
MCACPATEIRQIGATAGHLFTACGVAQFGLTWMVHDANGREQGYIPKLRQCLEVPVSASRHSARNTTS